MHKILLGCIPCGKNIEQQDSPAHAHTHTPPPPNPLPPPLAQACHLISALLACTSGLYKFQVWFSILVPLRVTILDKSRMPGRQIKLA